MKNYGIPFIGLVLSSSLIPSLKKLQINGVNIEAIMLVQEVLSVIFRTILIVALQGWKSDDLVFDLFQKSGKWWTLTLVIGALSVFASFVYLYILKNGNGIDFIAYETPITLIMTFLIAPLFLQGQELTKEKLCGIGLIGAGLYFFNK